jgi:hypothetical protein
VLKALTEVFVVGATNHPAPVGFAWRKDMCLSKPIVGLCSSVQITKNHDAKCVSGQRVQIQEEVAQPALS